MKKTFFIECILCVLLLFTSITLSLSENKKAAQAGTFGNSYYSNDTFEDLSENLLSKLLA